jgi:hypothetical protein
VTKKGESDSWHGDFFIAAEAPTEDQEAIEPIVESVGCHHGYMNPYIQLEEKSMDEHL